jgi:hypothetical protein
MGDQGGATTWRSRELLPLTVPKAASIWPHRCPGLDTSVRSPNASALEDCLPLRHSDCFAVPKTATAAVRARCPEA